MHYCHDRLCRRGQVVPNPPSKEKLADIADAEKPKEDDGSSISSDEERTQQESKHEVKPPKPPVPTTINADLSSSVPLIPVKLMVGFKGADNSTGAAIDTKKPPAAGSAAGDVHGKATEASKPVELASTNAVVKAPETSVKATNDAATSNGAKKEGDAKPPPTATSAPKGTDSAAVPNDKPAANTTNSKPAVTAKADVKRDDEEDTPAPPPHGCCVIS